jgi:hypothetical protein
MGRGVDFIASMITPFQKSFSKEQEGINSQMDNPISRSPWIKAERIPSGSVSLRELEDSAIPARPLSPQRIAKALSPFPEGRLQSSGSQATPLGG